MAPDRGQIFDPVEHVLEIFGPEDTRLRIERPRQLLWIVVLLLGQGAQKFVECRPQVLSEFFDLILARPLFQRLSQRFLGARSSCSVCETLSSMVTAMAHNRATTSRSWSSLVASSAASRSRAARDSARAPA